MGKLNYKNAYTRPINPDYTGMFDRVRKWKPLSDEQTARANRYADLRKAEEDEMYKTTNVPVTHMPLTRQQAYDDAYQMEQEFNNFLRPTYQRKVFAEPGNINSSDLKVRDYSLPAVFYASPDAGQLYMDDGINGKGREGVPVRRDLSNADANASYYTYEDSAPSHSKRVWGAERTDLGLAPMIADRLNNAFPKKLAGQIASKRNMLSAFNDWTSYLRHNSWANSYYDMASQAGESSILKKQRDAQILSAALGQAGGDLSTAFRLALGKMSSYGQDALNSMIGYFNPSEVPEDDRLVLRTNDAARFFNATRDAEDLASKYYTFDDSRATYAPKFYDPLDPDNLQGRATGISYDDYMRQSAANDLRLSDRAKAAISQNRYARGGHLRTPNTIRSRNGLKMRRADDLGNSDYDIYF